MNEVSSPIISGSVVHAPLRVVAVTRKADSASFEQRVTHYIPHLASMGIEVVCRKLPGSLAGQWKLMNELGSDEPGAAAGERRRRFDLVWWHRHMLNGVMRYKLGRQGLPVVFDFDDPLPYSSETNKISSSRSRRFAAFLKKCDASLPASDYLRDLALPYCAMSPVHPMAIDMPASEVLRSGANAACDGGVVELLWLGGKSTQVYLEELRRPLELLAQQRPGVVKLRLVAHEPMSFGALAVDFRKWSFEEQEKSLRECHVGLCPMPFSPWTQGKCPFKVIQYMAYGLPWVGSAVGANLISAGDASNQTPRGLCAADEGQWLAALLKLVDDKAGRLAMGDAGRAYAAAAHDRVALARQLADIFTQVARGR